MKSFEYEMAVEIFSPPYLFDGNGELRTDRPEIEKAPGEVAYTSVFDIETKDDATSITSVVLLRCGAVTHSFNSDQRYVELEIISKTIRAITVQLGDSQSRVDS